MILNGNLTKVILTLSLPIMLGNLIQTIYNLTDTYFVSLIGDQGVTAIQITWSLVWMMMAFGMGLSIASVSMISQYIGAHRDDDAKRVAGQIVTFSFLFSIVIAVVGFFVSQPVLRLIGAEGSLLQDATGYLRIMFLGMPTMFVMFAYNSIKQGQGDTVKPMILSGLSVGLNIILDPIFMFTFGWGINGAAIATVLARGIFSIYAIWTLFQPGQGIQLSLSDLRIKKDTIWQLVKIGAPSSFGQATAAFGFTILNAFILDYGTMITTAFAVGNRITSLTMMPAMGIGNALSSIVGQNLGDNNTERAKKAVLVSMGIAVSIMLASGLIMFPFSENIASIFIKNPETLAHAKLYMQTILLSLPLMGIFQVLVGTFQGSGHTISSMVMMIGRLWLLRIPMVILFSKILHLGPEFIWYAMIISNTITCIVGFIMFSTGRWQHKIIKDKKAVS